jgi:DNA-binding transcriptional ArsR family regulator
MFAALADPTRRQVVETLLRERQTTVPELTAALPMTRQAVAKHLAMLDDAGLVERAPVGGRQVHYRLREGALVPVTRWIRDAEAAWDARLERLRRAVRTS